MAYILRNANAFNEIKETLTKMNRLANLTLYFYTVGSHSQSSHLMKRKNENSVLFPFMRSTAKFFVQTLSGALIALLLPSLQNVKSSLVKKHLQLLLQIHRVDQVF